MIDVRCPECGQAFSPPGAMPGENHICPNCGNVTTVPLPTAVAVGTDPPADVHYRRVGKQSSGLAVVAMVLGICGFVPVLGAVTGLLGISIGSALLNAMMSLLGIVLGVVVLAGREPGKGLAISGVVAGAVSLVLILVGDMAGPRLQSLLGSARALSRPAVCRRNLSSIGKAVQVYMADNGDLAPPNLQALVDEKLLARHQLACPSEGTDGNVDYFYFRLPAGVPGNSLMACDLKGNHGGEGRNVLYLGGWVDCLTWSAFHEELFQPRNADFAKVEGP